LITKTNKKLHFSQLARYFIRVQSENSIKVFETFVSKLQFGLVEVPLTENVFPLTPTPILTLILTLALTLSLKHNNVFGLTKWHHFSSNTDLMQFA